MKHHFFKLQCIFGRLIYSMIEGTECADVCCYVCVCVCAWVRNMVESQWLFSLFLARCVYGTFWQYSSIDEVQILSFWFLRIELYTMKYFIIQSWYHIAIVNKLLYHIFSISQKLYSLIRYLDIGYWRLSKYSYRFWYIFSWLVPPVPKPFSVGRKLIKRMKMK